MDFQEFLFVEAVISDHRWADLRMRCTDEDAHISMSQLYSDYKRLSSNYASLQAYVEAEVYIKTFGF